jgi:O-antigen/teichoic acid export membrane protein
MKRKIFHDISASSVQVFINQICGILIFYILSKYISKSIFGEISWCVAVLILSFAVLGFGIDQVIVRKTAGGIEASNLAYLYAFHLLLTGVFFLILLWLIKIFMGESASRANTLFLLAAGQLLIFLSMPFKQIANGKELFRPLLVMSVGANIVKVAGLLILANINRLNLDSFIELYISASAIELMICIYMGRRSLNISPRLSFDLKQYKGLVRESLPQLGVIICNAGIARFDWVLLGLISTTSILAEYSFAYKAFEISTLPLFIIAPLLLPRITRWFRRDSGEALDNKNNYLITLVRFEVILACLGSLVLNIIWSPFVDSITNYKYGSVNQHTILILSACVPFLYVNNVLWSINFARNQMKLILSVFAVTFLITCGGDLILIPFFHAEGAAFAYFIAISVQTIHFLSKTQLENAGRIHYYLFLGIGTALVSGFLASFASGILWMEVLISVSIYLFILVLSRQIRFTDLFRLKRMVWA